MSVTAVSSRRPAPAGRVSRDRAPAVPPAVAPVNRLRRSPVGTTGHCPPLQSQHARGRFLGMSRRWGRSPVPAAGTAGWWTC